MRNLRLGFSLIGLSLFVLTVLRFVPGSWIDDVNFANSTISYVVLGSIFYVSVYFLGLPSLEYFRLPRFNYKTVVALLAASIFVFLKISSSDNVYVSPWVVVRGVCFLLAVGFGEEMFSRAFTFGVLRKFGLMKAIFISSFLFGLMHLNLYVGANWDGWHAYWHVTDAFGFGVFACALMIVTRSIWLAVIFHALCNWNIVFGRAQEATSKGVDWGVSSWEGIRMPLFNVFLYVGLALVLLWIDRGGTPGWLYRLALRLKLVNPEFELTV